MEIFAVGSNLVHFAEGWDTHVEGEPSSPHRWSTSLTASVRIPKITHNPLKMGVVRVELDAMPFLAQELVTYQDVFMYIDGMLLSALRLWDSSVHQVETDYISPHTQVPFSNLKFVLPNSSSPLSLGCGLDQRQLGIGFKSLKIQVL
jgi:hypothetical protein